MRGVVRLAMVAALSATLVVTGCGTVDAAKSGGGTPPMTLQLATGDPQGRASGLAAEAWAREIEEGSRGRIEVEVLWQSFLGADWEDPTAINDYSGETYSEVARQVEEGEVELAVVPDFAWVQRGSRTVEALKVPLLIDSVDLMIEVARRVGVEPLADLEDLDVTPLGLIPEGLRHPVGFDRPLTALADFEGSGIRSVDATAWPTLEAWARPVSIPGSFARAVEDGSVVGTETSFTFADTLPRSGVFTGNVTHTAKFTTLVASTDWWLSLSADDRSMIEDAAASTFSGVAETLSDEEEAGAVYCERGGTVVHAAESERSSLEEAVGPLVARLRADPLTAATVKTISDLKSELPPARTAAECSPTPPGQPPAGDPEQTAAFPQGTYRAELTVQDFTTRGVAEDVARNHADIWTLTFRDGQVWDIDCPGSTYSVRDGRVSIVLGQGDPACGDVAGGELFSAAWTFDGRVLRFHDVMHGVEGPTWQTFAEVLWGSQDWVKIG